VMEHDVKNGRQPEEPRLLGAVRSGISSLQNTVSYSKLLSRA
jgi:hypothetical protein